MKVQNSTQVKGITHQGGYYQQKPSNDTFWSMSMPLILDVPIQKSREDNMMGSMSERVCFFGACTESDLTTEPGRITMIDGDVLAMPVSTHYFHFVYETASMLESLHMHGILHKLSNSTLLCFGEEPTASNKDMLDVLGIPPLPAKIIKGKPNVWYQATGKTIVPSFNNYHVHQDPYKSYNQWIFSSIRSRLPRITHPHRALFLSRKGVRRAIRAEAEIYDKLKTTFLPHLENIVPHHYNLTEQATMFAAANLIISAHGAALTNLIFSDWNQVTVIEITPELRPATFRNDLQIQHHYLLTCPSFSDDSKDLWDLDMDCHVDQTVNVIQHILIHDINATQEEISTTHSIPESPKN